MPGRSVSFFSVMLPSIRIQIAVCLTVTVILSLASFDIVFVATGGGPGHQTMVPGVQIYRLAFAHREVGLASVIRAGVGHSGWRRSFGLASVIRAGVGHSGWRRSFGLASVIRAGVGHSGWRRSFGLVVMVLVMVLIPPIQRLQRGSD